MWERYGKYLSLIRIRSKRLALERNLTQRILPMRLSAKYQELDDCLQPELVCQAHPIPIS
jgi:hypothetical protein